MTRRCELNQVRKRNSPNLRHHRQPALENTDLHHRAMQSHRILPTSGMWPFERWAEGFSKLVTDYQARVRCARIRADTTSSSTPIKDASKSSISAL